MNKFLLASMAMALACAPVSAQLQMKQITPVVKKTNLFPQGNLKLSDKQVLSLRQTRAGEEEGLPLDPKSILNMGGWDRNIYTAGLQGETGMVLHIGTFYDPMLLARFDGNKLTSIRTVIGPNMKDLQAYILDAQTGEKVWEGKKLPSFNNTTTKSKTVNFPCDYTIDKNTPIIVVYKVTAKSSDIKLSIVNNVVNNGFLLDVEGDQAEGFQDLGVVNGVAAYIECVTEGKGGLKANDVAVLDVAGGRVVTDEKYGTIATFVNYGTNPISKISTTYDVNGDEVKQEVSSQKPFPFMAPIQVELEANSPAEAARYLQHFTIPTVNGVADEYTAEDVFSKKPDNEAQNVLTVMSQKNPRTVVMEQFTGTWCGWCPRGHVAMEKAAKAYPEQFVGIAVHAGDEMETKEYGPLLGMVGGFPSAMLNRIGYSIVDPYYGSQGQNQDPAKSGDIINDIKAIASMPVEATANVSSSLKGNSVDVTSSFDFALNTEGAYYSVAYVLLENGLKGYLQNNYYGKGIQGGFASADQIPEEDLRFLFEEGRNGKYMPTFNHVARSIKDVGGIQGSLNDVKIQQGVKVTHHASITLPATIANSENLEVVVLLIDNITGEIVTAKKAKIGQSTGIENVQGDAAEVTVEQGAIHVEGNGKVALYTVDGKLVKSEAVNGTASVSTVGLKGVYVVRVVNGNHVTVKKIML